MGKSIGSLVFNFGANLSGFDRAMKKAQKSIKKFGKSMQKVGSTMTKNITLPILGLAAVALKFGSDLQETDAKFKTVFSSLQKEAEETAKVFKDSFGLSELAAKEMLSGTGDLLVGIGLTEDSALDLSTKINELAVDLASFTNFSGGAKGASEALTKALLGERDSIKSLGISITEADLKEFAADQGLVWKELDKGTKALLTYELAAKQSFKAIGDFERTSGSFANQMRIVKGELVDVASEMGARLIPFAQAAIDKLKELIKWFDGLSDATKDNIVKWGLIIAAIGPVLIIIGKLSIGVSALIPLFVRLAAVAMANPYILLLAAIAAVYYAIYTLIDSLWGQVDVQKEISKLNDTASKRIAGDISKIDSLVFAINSENATLETKRAAIQELKDLYPKYYGELDETTFSTDTLKVSTDKLKESLMQVAKTEVLASKLKKVNEAIVEIELNAGKPSSLMKWVTKLNPGLIVVNKTTDLFTKGNKDLMDIVQTKLDLTSLKNLKTIQAALLDQTVKLKNENSDVNEEIKKVTHSTSTSTNVTKKNTKSNKENAESYGELTFKVVELGNQLGKIPETLEHIDFDFTKSIVSPFTAALGIMGDEIAMFLGMDVKELEEGLGSMATTLGDNLAQGAEDLKAYTKEVKGMMREQIGALISKGVASAISKAMEGMAAFPGSVFLIPIIAGAAAGLARTAFNSLIPAFDAGGLVTGPTMGLIGEGAGTSISNPEVVAPLDKLKNIMGGGSQNIVVTGKIVGNDIWLSNEKTQFNRERTT